jgi:hypothetical protein
MLTRELLMSWMEGTGIAVNARQRWGSLPLAENLRFADVYSIAELRAKHPEWRALSLAPVSIIDDVVSLPSLHDDSLDYIVAYHLLMDEAKIFQAYDTAGRLLRAGGNLLIPVPDERYAADGGLELTAIRRGLERLGRELHDDAELCETLISNEGLTCEHLAIVMSRFAASKQSIFDLEAVGRNGLDNLVVFRRKIHSRLNTGDLIERDSAIYVVDGPAIRHVSTLQIFERIRKGKPIYRFNQRDFSSWVVGLPFLEEDVEILLRTEGNSK